MGESLFAFSFSTVSWSSLRSIFVPTRTIGVFGQWWFTSGNHWENNGETGINASKIRKGFVWTNLCFDIFKWCRTDQWKAYQKDILQGIKVLDLECKLFAKWSYCRRIGERPQSIVVILACKIIMLKLILRVCIFDINWCNKEKNIQKKLLIASNGIHLCTHKLCMKRIKKIDWRLKHYWVYEQAKNYMFE